MTSQRKSGGHSAGRLRFTPGPTTHTAGPPGLIRLDGPSGQPGGLALVPAVSAAGQMRVLLLLHGAGGTAVGALKLLREQAEHHALLLVAPKSAADTWDVISGGYGPDVHNIDEMLLRVSADYPVTGYSIGGFSDGASYALSLGATNGDVFDSIVAFSPGFTAARTSRGRPRVFVSHGLEDPVLPIERCSRRIVPTLRGKGYDVTYVEFEGGHSVPLPIRRRAVTWLTH